MDEGHLLRYETGLSTESFALLTYQLHCRVYWSTDRPKSFRMRW